LSEDDEHQIAAPTQSKAVLHRNFIGQPRRRRPARRKRCQSQTEYALSVTATMPYPATT
jgi:hypothetical protein